MCTCTCIQSLTQMQMLTKVQAQGIYFDICMRDCMHVHTFMHTHMHANGLVLARFPELLTSMARPTDFCKRGGVYAQTGQQLWPVP